MRSILVLIVVAVCRLGAHGQQSITPSVHNLIGMDVAMAQWAISASVGEPAVTTLYGEVGSITQGFLQPEILPCVNVEMRYYPNPAPDMITIEAFGCEIKIKSVQIVDLWGRSIVILLPLPDNQFHLGDLSQGMYFAKVNLTNGTSQTINLVKITN